MLSAQLFVEAALLLLTTLPAITTVVASLPQAISLCPGDCLPALMNTAALLVYFESHMSSSTTISHKH